MFDHTEFITMGASLYKIRKNNRYGFIDRAGRVVIQPQYLGAEDFFNGYSRVLLNNSIVPMDELGRLYLKRLYHYVGRFFENRARVQLIHNWGFIDTQGDLVIDIQYEDASNFQEGLAAVSRNRQFGFIDISGQWMIEPGFTNAKDFSGGMAIVQNPFGRWGGIDKKGNEMLPFEFDEIMEFSEDRAAAQKNGMWGLIDRSGKWVLEPCFPVLEGKDPGVYSEGLIPLFNGEYWVYIDLTGQVRTEVPFSELQPLRMGIGVAGIKDKLGYVDGSGNWVIPPHFDLAHSFHESGLAVTGKKDLSGFIDWKGNEVIPFRYLACYDFNDGLARVILADERWSYLNEDGILVWEET